MELTPKEVSEKYSTVPLMFKSYYKFVFTYHGVAKDGNIITVRYGGMADDVYRYEVSRDDIKVLGEYEEKASWNPWTHGWSGVLVETPEKDTILYEYDYHW